LVFSDVGLWISIQQTRELFYDTLCLLALFFHLIDLGLAVFTPKLSIGPLAPAWKQIQWKK
jgi:hypothetical protein